MKIPYSYRQQFFTPVLWISLAGHAVVFTAGAGLFSLSPEYAVERSASSMEIVITQPEPKPDPEPLRQEEIMTAPQAVEQTVPVKEIKKKEEEKPKPKPVETPLQRGAARKEASAHLQNPAPVYPTLARERGWEGVVVLRVLVQSDGNSGEVTVDKSSGYKILDESALKTIRKWKFKPASVGDLAFSSWVRIPVRFSLVDEDRMHFN